MIVLDTDVLSIVQRADGPAYDRLAQRLDAADDEVAVSIVSFEEQMRGWLAYVARSKTLNQKSKVTPSFTRCLMTSPSVQFSTSIKPLPPGLNG